MPIINHIIILGAEWTIEVLTDKQWSKHEALDKKKRKNRDVHGICFGYQRKILIRKNLEEKHRKAVLKHEIIHAFQYESGVFYAMSFNWDVENDTEWLACALPKITKVLDELNI